MGFLSFFGGFLGGFLGWFFAFLSRFLSSFLSFFGGFLGGFLGWLFAFLSRFLAFLSWGFLSFFGGFLGGFLGWFFAFFSNFFAFLSGFLSTTRFTIILSLMSFLVEGGGTAPSPSRAEDFWVVPTFGVFVGSTASTVLRVSQAFSSRFLSGFFDNFLSWGFLSTTTSLGVKFSLVSLFVERGSTAPGPSRTENTGITSASGISVFGSATTVLGNFEFARWVGTEGS